MKFAKSAIAGILLLLAASASAQQFPTVPANSVIGRLGTPGQSGPSQAIPLATLFSRAPNNNVVPLSSFCAVDPNGLTDMGACINAALAAAKNCSIAGNTTVLVPTGTYLITTPIVPKSCTNLVGDGRGKTKFLTNTNTPLQQTSGSQLVHFNMSGITFKDSGTHPGATALLFTTIQGSRLVNLGFHGYTSGTAMSINPNGVAVSGFDDSTGIWNSSNSFFNTFEDWVDDDQLATGLILAGSLATPCSTASATNVITLNVFKDIHFWGITGVGWNLVRAADSNEFTGVNIIRLIGSGGAVITPHASFKNIAVQLGDDNATCATNNDVALERMQLTVSMGSPATSFVMFNAGNNTFGHIIDFQTDQPSNVNSGFTAMAGVTGVCYTINGRNYTPTLDDGVGNLFQLELDQCKYRAIMDGTAAKPSVAFASELGNGVFRPGAGVYGLSAAISSGSNGGTLGRLLLNGNTSGQAIIQPQAAAGTPTLTLGTSSGTPAVTASAPLAIAAATGNATCATCATTTNGGALSATAPISISAAGNITFDTAAWAAFTPSYTCGTATFTNNSSRSKTTGKSTFLELDFTITALGTCTNAVTFTLPNTSQSPGSINGSETVNTNAAAFCRFASATTTATCIVNGGGNFAVNARVIASGVYENQ